MLVVVIKAIAEISYVWKTTLGSKVFQAGYFGISNILVYVCIFVYICVYWYICEMNYICFAISAEIDGQWNFMKEEMLFFAIFVNVTLSR